jgi:hypothetical protein
MAVLDVFGSLAEGAASGQKYAETLAQPEILKKAYAGATPEEVAKDPAKQQSIYAQAAAMAGQRGMNQLAYTFQKQASELSTAAQTQQLNDLKIKEQQATYANQLLSGAQTEQDLRDIVDKTVTDPAARLQVESILKRDGISTEDKKKILLKMTETAKDRIDTQRLLLEGKRTEVEEKGLKIREKEADARIAEFQLNIDYKQEGRENLQRQREVLQFEKRIKRKKEEGKALSEEEKQFDDEGIVPSDLISRRPAVVPTTPTTTPTATSADKAATAREPSMKVSSAAQKQIDKDNRLPILKQELKDTQDKLAAAKSLEDRQRIQYDIDAINREISKIDKSGVSGTKGATYAGWDEITPEFREKHKLGEVEGVAKAFNLPPQDFVGFSQKKRDAINGSYSAIDKSEKVAEMIRKNPQAVGTLAAAVNKIGGGSLNVIDNLKVIAKNENSKYTTDVVVLAKELFTLGLEDAQAGSAGRMNQYLERRFASIYDPSLSAGTLLQVLKTREKDNADSLTRLVPKAKASSLTKEEFPLLNSKSGADYLKEAPKTETDYEASAAPRGRTTTVPGAGGSRTSGMSQTERAPLSSFQR